jgi:hypothetical protein
LARAAGTQAECRGRRQQYRCGGEWRRRGPRGSRKIMV